MPDPRTWQEWFRVGDDHLHDARAGLQGVAPFRGLIRSAAQAAESYLKGLIARRDPEYCGKKHRHDLHKLLAEASKDYPSMQNVEAHVDILRSVRYEQMRLTNKVPAHNARGPTTLT